MLNKKDYLLVAIVGFFFGLLLLPVLNNIKVAFLPVNLINGIAIIIFFTIVAVVALWIMGIIAKKIFVMLEIAKFAAVGGLNTLLDLGVLNLLISIFAIASGAGYAVFKGISFIVSNVNSYFWNKYWTFGSNENATVKEFGQFLIVSVIGFIINISVASIVVNVIKPLNGMSPARWANVGALVATLTAFVWNFIGYKFIVFVKKKSLPEKPQTQAI